MLKIQLIRHTMTKGNLLGRYIGKTDEPLCKEGIQLLYGKSYQAAEQVYVSPLMRCVQTADLIFENVPQKVVESLRECDFGDFENKNYKELEKNASYQSWIDSQGKMPFPGGESPEYFKRRCCLALCEIIKDALRKEYRNIAIVAHGGTIMSIMERYGKPEASFYDWQVKNAGGYLLELDEEKWIAKKKVCVKSSL